MTFQQQRGFAALLAHSGRSNSPSIATLGTRVMGAPARFATHEMRSISCVS
jgi:hypothetical protein